MELPKLKDVMTADVENTVGEMPEVVSDLPEVNSEPASPEA
jgi:hypothetical protein